MDNFTPLKTKNKKKKANKFLIIGNLLLVIIVAGIGFFYYNNTLITIRQKAQTVAEKKAEEARKKEYEESGKKDADREAKKKKEQEARRLEQEEIGGGGCPGGYTQCDVQDTGGTDHRFCLDETKKTGCYNEAVERGITVKTGGGVSTSVGGWRCVVGLGRDRPYVAGQPCVDYNSVETIGNTKVPNCFCGIIQIDNSSGGGTYESECGCNKEELAQIQSSSISTPTATPIISNTSTPTRTPTPTATPVISNTPTVTPLISNTPTVTPLISNTPTVTPLISNTPGPSATPTEIILAKISTSPTVVKLLQTAVLKPFMYLIPVIIMLVGLIL
ncbi:MAG: hypothetical protein AAB441_04145 [Patescibacteria group bacterium]